MTTHNKDAKDAVAEVERAVKQLNSALYKAALTEEVLIDLYDPDNGITWAVQGSPLRATQFVAKIYPWHPDWDW